MHKAKTFWGGELTVRETAERLGVGIQFVYVLLWQKQLVARKDGNRWMISEKSVRARQHRLEKTWQQ